MKKLDIEKIIRKFNERNLEDFLKSAEQYPKEWKESDILQHWIEFQNLDEAVLYGE